MAAKKEEPLLTLRDAEEAAELMQRRAEWEKPLEPDYLAILEEYESQQVSLRRRVASALVQIGVRLDPGVTDDLKQEVA